MDGSPHDGSGWGDVGEVIDGEGAAGGRRTTTWGTVDLATAPAPYVDGGTAVIDERGQRDRRRRGDLGDGRSRPLATGAARLRRRR